MSKVILEGYVLVPESDLIAVTKELGNHIHLTRQEEGCIVFEVTPDPDNPGKLNVYEEFDTQEAFELHQQRVRSSEWGKITKNVERQYKIHGVG